MVTKEVLTSRCVVRACLVALAVLAGGLVGSTAAGAEIANSVTGFSSTQGLNGWEYGRLNGSTFTRLGSYVASSLTWSYNNNDIAPDYMLVWAAGGHPSKDDGLGLSTRRWTSGTTGFLTLSGSSSLNSSAGSVITYLLINGRTYVQTPLPSTTTARPYSFSVPVVAGDTIDLTLSSNGINSNDGTSFNMAVSNDLAGRVVLANSARDFAGTQAQADFSGLGSWSYGNYTTAGDASTFSTTTWVNSGGSVWQYGSSPSGVNQYTQQQAGYMHPGSGGSTTTAPVRHWVSGVTGKVYLDGFWSRSNPTSAGDGVIWEIRNSGTAVQSGTISQSDYAQQSFGTSIDVVAGQAVDFILQSRTESSYDGTNFNASISADAQATAGGTTLVGTGGLVALPTGSTQNGAISVSKGTLTLAAAGNVGSTATVDTAAGTGFDLSAISASSLTIAALTGSASSTVSLGGKTLIVSNAAASAFAGGIGGTGGLTKSGTGNLTLSASSSFSGATSITQGRLEIASGGRINGSSGVTINGGEFKYNSATALTAPITVTAGTLSGTGAINSALSLASTAAILSPGNSPGILSLGASQTWSGYTYVWEVNDFTTGTVAGVNFDQIAITGSLDLSGGTTNSFLLDLKSLLADNSPGNVGNFTDIDRSWDIITTTGGITGFDVADWQIQTTNFTSSPTWGGTWSVSRSANGNNVVLNYVVSAPVPEPGTLSLAAIGIAAAAWAIRRRR